MDDSRPTVAIVAWHALPAIDPRRGDRVGGMETAAWNFARGLARQGRFAPTLVFRAPRPGTGRKFHGVRLEARLEPFAAMRQRVSNSIRWRRRWPIVQWRLALLWEIPLLAMTWPLRRRDPPALAPDPRLARLRPELWIAMGVNQAAAGVLATARTQQCPAIVMIRSNADLDPRFAHNAAFQTAYGEASEVCREVLQRADAIVCQTEHQQQLLQTYFGRTGHLVRNPIDLEAWQRAAWKSREGGKDEEPYVAWVGRYDDFHKRPERVFALARRCPELRFRMIVNPSSPAIAARLRRERPANVELIDYLPHDAMPAFFAKARLLLSTSSAQYEGFPNILLQAAAVGCPIVSQEDFDQFLERSGAGVVCGETLSATEEAVRQAWQGSLPIEWAGVHRYLAEQHAEQAVLKRLADVLEAVRLDASC